MSAAYDIPALPPAPAALPPAVEVAWAIVCELHAQDRISRHEGAALLEGLRATVGEPRITPEAASSRSRPGE